MVEEYDLSTHNLLSKYALFKSPYDHNEQGNLEAKPYLVGTGSGNMKLENHLGEKTSFQSI